MLVDVTLLRYRRNKLPLDVLRRTPLRRGTLTIWLRRERGRVVRMASLTLGPHPSDPELVPMLYNARVNVLRGDDFVVVGQEHPSARRNGADVFRQSWLCRAVSRV